MIKVIRNEEPPGRSNPRTYGFELIEDGKTLARGHGFVSQGSCNDAIEVSKRRVQGLQPIQRPVSR